MRHAYGSRAKSVVDSSSRYEVVCMSFIAGDIKA